MQTSILFVSLSWFGSSQNNSQWNSIWQHRWPNRNTKEFVCSCTALCLFPRQFSKWCNISQRNKPSRSSNRVGDVYGAVCLSGRSSRQRHRQCFCTRSSARPIQAARTIGRRPHYAARTLAPIAVWPNVSRERSINSASVNINSGQLAQLTPFSWRRPGPCDCSRWPTMKSRDLPPSDRGLLAPPPHWRPLGTAVTWPQIHNPGWDRWHLAYVTHV